MDSWEKTFRLVSKILNSFMELKRPDYWEKQGDFSRREKRLQDDDQEEKWQMLSPGGRDDSVARLQYGLPLGN